MDEKLLPSILMSLLSFVSILFMLRGLRLSLRKTSWDTSQQQKIFLKTLLIIIAWVLLTGILAVQGFFADFSKLPPRPVFVMVIPLIILLITAFSKKGTELLKAEI